MAQYPSWTVVPESGPKNPRKGKTMKLLVLALDAQFRVGAGRMDCGRPVMAYGTRPVFRRGFFLCWHGFFRSRYG